MLNVVREKTSQAEATERGLEVFRICDGYSNSFGYERRQ